MTTPALHQMETSEGDDGIVHPVEQLWTPGDDAAENGFLAHRDPDEDGAPATWAA
ncbi:hypothetical protein [Streptomyces noursei]|uniref:hypothetical protein n=1 Tax=Streptomyces noursei TaxID=1971 RepID=UPI000A4D2FA4